MTTAKPGWLDLTPALTHLEALRTELRRLLALNPSQPQQEALRDALGALGLVERDLRDAEPPEGEHPGDRDANVCSSCLATYALELAACPECEVAP